MQQSHLRAHSHLLCLPHGNEDFADYLSKDENKKALNDFLKSIKENSLVKSEKEKLREERRLLLEQEIKIFSEKLRNSKNKFDLLENPSGPTGVEKGSIPENHAQPENPAQPAEKTESERRKHPDHELLFLEQYQQIVQRELDLIEVFQKNINEEKWDDLLNQVLEICKKPQEDLIDNHLLKIAKPCIATLLKLNYQHEFFKSLDFLPKLDKLGDLVDTPENKICILNRLLQEAEHQEKPIKTINKLLKTLFSNLQDIYDKKCDVGIFFQNDCRYFFKYLIKRKKLDKQVVTDYIVYNVYHGFFDIIKCLLENDVNKDINVDLQDSSNEGNIALMGAALQGHLEIVKYLIEKGANVNSVRKNGQNSLMFAVSQGHLEIVKHLIEKGANVNYKDNDGADALMIAALRGHLEIVKHLIENGANVNSVRINGVDALMIAALRGHLEIVKHLVENGANVDVKNNNDRAAWMIAASQDHMEIMRYLSGFGDDFKESMRLFVAGVKNQGETPGESPSQPSEGGTSKKGKHSRKR